MTFPLVKVITHSNLTLNTKIIFFIMILVRIKKIDNFGVIKTLKEK